MHRTLVSSRPAAVAVVRLWTAKQLQVISDSVAAYSNTRQPNRNQTMFVVKGRLRSAWALLVLTVTTGAVLSALPPVDQVKSPVMVEFEYQMEVNGGATPVDVQSKIDSNILAALQAMLPSGGPLTTATGATTSMPNVRFEDVSSDIFSLCFTTADECALVRSRILIQFDGQKPEYSVERVALRLIRNYLQTVNAQSSELILTYQYPFLIGSTIQFELSPVDSEMEYIEKWIMLESFMEVFGTIVNAIEGDTIILDANFVYQDVKASSNETSSIRRGNDFDTETTVGPFVLSSTFQLLGACRNCRRAEFSGMVNAVIQGNLPVYRSKLQRNGAFANTTYFVNVTEISFHVPKPPQFLDPTEDEALYNAQAPQAERIYPWFFYFGLALAFSIITVGFWFIRQELVLYAKEEYNEKADSDFSTSSESDEVSDGPSSIASHMTGLHSQNNSVTRSMAHSQGSARRLSSSKRQRPTSARLDATGMIYEYSVDDGSIDNQVLVEKYHVETILDETIERG